jgi:hypothetical protein
MRHGEYERRRRALDTQYREDLELIRAGYQAKLRALEMLWFASPATDAAARGPVPSVGGDPGRDELEEERPAPAALPSRNETQGEVETQTNSETQSPETQGSEMQPSETQEPVRQMPPGGLVEAIRDVLPQLPEVFDRHALEKALGFAPPRSTTVRILLEMWHGKELAIEESSLGRRPTKYRKVVGI